MKINTNKFTLKKKLHQNQHAFTLIELLVVVSLLGVLATLVIANLNSARERARDATRKSDLRSIQTALRLYYNDNSGYPQSFDGNIVGCDGNCTWGEAWVNDNVTYMNILPNDPLTGQSYVYTGVVGGEDYTLMACLENKSDDKGVAVATSVCASGYKYEVKP